MSDRVSMDTYKRTGLVFVRGSGSTLEAEDGRIYLDFASGIGVNSLGHAHPGPLRRHSGAGLAPHPRVQLLPEPRGPGPRRGALRRARGWTPSSCATRAPRPTRARSRSRASTGPPTSPPRTTIVTLRGSFHGRTIATLAATGQDKFHEQFGPFPAGFAYVEPEDASRPRGGPRPECCALLLEPIQGESGVIPLSDDYLRLAAKLCAERGILLIADEVQCGVGADGKLPRLEPGGRRARRRYPGARASRAACPSGRSSPAGRPRGARAGRPRLDLRRQSRSRRPRLASSSASSGAPGFLEAVARKGERILADPPFLEASPRQGSTRPRPHDRHRRDLRSRQGKGALHRARPPGPDRGERRSPPPPSPRHHRCGDRSRPRHC